MIPAAFIEQLRRRLAGPLPGQQAQFKMAPVGRPRPGIEIQIPADAKKSAVLILLCPGPSGVEFPLIQRPSYDGAHSGQVGLPGGRHEPEDLDFGHTALRETEEEIGVPQQKIEILGALSEIYIPPSNFWVQPYVGFMEEMPHFLPDPNEVVEVLRTPLAQLQDPGSMGTAQVMASYGARQSPAFLMHDRVIWGATAMILSEFLAVLD